MKTYQVPVWNCTCGYSQDFDPTTENQHLHFNSDTGFPLSDLKANECPSCALKGVRDQPLTEGTVEQQVLELSDLDTLQVDTLSGPRSLTSDERAQLAAQIQSTQARLGQ